MTDNFPEEKIKPFRLVKYFTFSSLIFIFLGALVLSLLNAYWARRMLLQKNEEYAKLLIANLDHQIYVRFALPARLVYGKIQFGEKEQREWADDVVKSTLHGFRVDTVNIYDEENTLIYHYRSTPPIEHAEGRKNPQSAQLGEKHPRGTGYQNALKGISTSIPEQKWGSLWALLLGFPKESKLKTFGPMRGDPSANKDMILGIVEIVQDLSEDYKAILKVQTRVMTTSGIVMGILFIILLFVAKRGEEIIEKRAQERLKLKEQLSRAERLSTLGEMVATISHEIRNPLGIIRSSAELLKKKMVKNDADNSIPEIIVEEAGRLNRIITDFLNFARPREPIMVPCRIDTIVDKNITFLTAQIGEQNYHIEKKYPDTVPEIMADADMLYQAFLNVFINAIQAMPDGGKLSVEIRCNKHAMDIIVEDSGKGVSDEVMEKIWDPFFSTKEKGTGLGLGIVKNIVEQHHGHIHLKNKDNGGARVVIELPYEFTS